MSLEVAQCAPDPQVGRTCFSSYAMLNPNQRAYYLRWLANGRAHPLENTNYVLLFFYGLERRVLVEQLDLNTIVDEVTRLLEYYPSCRILDAYLNSFLAFSLARVGIEIVDDRLFRAAFEKSRRISDRDFLAVALAWFYKRKIQLPASWASRIARQDPRFPKSHSLDRHPERFKSLFEDRFKHQFGDGPVLEASASNYELFYRPASPSLILNKELSGPSTMSTKIPDVLGLESQFSPLISVWRSCIEDLSLPSRAADKEIHARTRPELAAQSLSVAITPQAARAPQTDPRGSSRIESLEDFPGRTQIACDKDTSRRTHEHRWCGNGDSVTAGQHLLLSPMVYISDGKPPRDEASCIDLSLQVGNPVEEAPGSLGYHTTYARLSPNQRSNYLQWLSKGRVEPLHDIGYAFLFFYGLERRLLVERQDLNPIIEEVVRLLEAYTFSGSFDGYLSRFLVFALARAGIETLKDKWFDAVFEKSRLQRDEDFLAVALAWFFKRNAPLPISWAMRIARHDSRSLRSIVIDPLLEQFKSLFEKRYRERFGDGLILQVSERDRSLSYRPASPSLLSDIDLSRRSNGPVKIPNVLGIQSQFTPLVAIWSSCIEELRPLSRLLAKGIEFDSREAFESLPG